MAVAHSWTEMINERTYCAQNGTSDSDRSTPYRIIQWMTHMEGFGVEIDKGR